MKTNLFSKLLLVFFVLGYSLTHGQTPSTIRALTVLIDFPDYPAPVPATDFEPMFNQSSGYNGYGFNGSINEYWSDVSNGKMNYTSEIVGWYTAANNRSTYETSNYSGLDNLVNEVIPQLENMNFNGLTLRPGTNEILSLNVIVYSNWGSALRPVAFSLQAPVKIYNNGVEASLRVLGNSVTFANFSMGMDQILHETGHAAFGWPEHYQEESRVGNIGYFGLMGYSGNNRKDNPTPPNPALRLRMGWIDNIISLNVSNTQSFVANTNDLNQIFKYTNPNNPLEYYLVEPYMDNDRYDGMPDEGLAIWYVDEGGGLSIPGNNFPYKVKIMEADGNNHIENGALGGNYDLFVQGENDSFSDFTNPQARWKDGSLTGLDISNISAVGNTMSFTVNVKDYVLSATSGDNGRVEPSGTIRANHGGFQAFNFYPDLGYDIKSVYVNGANYGKLNGYSDFNITSDKTVSVEFEKATSGYELPSPWMSANMGNNVDGEVAYQSGVFEVKGYGWDIWNNTDDFYYVYQPLSGDGEIIAQITQDPTTDWTKAGVMIREDLGLGSKHALMATTPFNGPAFQYRTSTNGSSSNSNSWGNFNTWVKLVREGDLFTGYHSSDGINWVQQGKATISMGTDVYVGLASNAATYSVKKKARFENVEVISNNNGGGLLAQYNVPRTSSLPHKFGHYNHVEVIGNGGPNLSNVFNSIFNWDGYNKALYQFSLETNNGNPRWYTGLEGYASHTLGQSSPTITFNNTGFAGLDGTYYVNEDGYNLVLVEQSGAYALYFSNTNSRVALNTQDAEVSESFVAPSPFQGSTILNLADLDQVQEVNVFNVSGRLMETISGNEISASVELGNNYPVGMYLIQIQRADGMQTLKVTKN